MSLDNLTNDELAAAYLALVSEVIANAPATYALDTNPIEEPGACSSEVCTNLTCELGDWRPGASLITNPLAQ